MLTGIFFRLPPGLAVAALFVGLTLPQAMLGLPVAAAEIGALPALGVLVAVGAAMTVAAAAESEALVRDADFRRGDGTAFFGRLVERYLGGPATVLPNALAALRTSLSVLGAYVGFSVTLASLTGIHRSVCGGLALLALAVLLLRGGLRIPTGLGAVLGLLCLPPLLGIGAIAVLHGGGQLGASGDFDVTSLGAVVGVAVMLYISGVYVVRLARDALPRDPGGRSLVRGSAAGTVALTVLSGAWLLATSAALDPSQLAGETGTVLGPLATETGTAAAVLGGLLTVLLLGLGMERTSLAVMRLLAERLPVSAPRPVPALAPLAVCLIGEGLLWADAISFAGIFGVAGIATNVLLAVALPLMLLLAARRGGDLDPAPGARVPVFGRPRPAWSLIGLAAVLLLLFATVLGDGSLLRLAAAASLAALVATAWLARRAGAFGP